MIKQLTNEHWVDITEITYQKKSRNFLRAGDVIYLAEKWGVPHRILLIKAGLQIADLDDAGAFTYKDGDEAVDVHFFSVSLKTGSDFGSARKYTKKIVHQDTGQPVKGYKED